MARRVIVEVKGGAVEVEILSGSDVSVLVIDYDTDGMDEDELSEVDGQEAAVTLHTPDGFPPRTDQTYAFETLWQAGVNAIKD